MIFDLRVEIISNFSFNRFISKGKTMSQVNHTKNCSHRCCSAKWGRAVLSELLDGAHPNTILAGGITQKKQ